MVSLVVGIAMGLVFERRATHIAKRQNEELQRQISVLKTSILSVGGDSEGVIEESLPDDLAAQVTARAIATQDPDGRVNRGALVAHFIKQGHRDRDIDMVISSLCETGTAKEDRSWLQMT